MAMETVEERPTLIGFEGITVDDSHTSEHTAAAASSGGSEELRLLDLGESPVQVCDIYRSCNGRGAEENFKHHHSKRRHCHFYMHIAT